MHFVKRTTILGLVSLFAMVAAGCGEGTPTRTPRAVAENIPTQTPWIIYIPVTTTPEPFTATPLPTVTPSQPEPTVPPTALPVTPRPRPTQPPQPEASPTPAEPPTPELPTVTPTPSCGQEYTVTTLTFPENGAKRRARPGSGAGATIQFMWEPVANHELDPRIGYRVNISTPQNRQALYISHNQFLKDKLAILNQQATYGMTQGDDATAQWYVEVIMATGEFNDAGDDTTPPQGTVVVCGMPSPTWTIELAVEE